MPTSAVQTTTTAAGAMEYKYNKIFRDAVYLDTRFAEWMRKGLPKGGRFEQMEEENLRSARAIWRMRYKHDEGNSAHDEGGAFGTRSSPAWAQMWENVAQFNLGVNISNLAMEIAKSRGAGAIEADKDGLIRDSLKTYLAEFNRRLLGAGDGVLGVVNGDPSTGTIVTYDGTLPGTLGSTYYDPMTGRNILQSGSQFLRNGMVVSFLDPAYLGDDSGVTVRTGSYTIDNVTDTTFTVDSACDAGIEDDDIIVKYNEITSTPTFRTFHGLASLVNTDGGTTTGATGVVETLRWSDMHHSGSGSLSQGYSPSWFQSYVRFLGGAVMTRGDVMRTLQKMAAKGAQIKCMLTSPAVMLKYDETQVQPMVRLNRGAAGTVPYTFTDGMAGTAFQYNNTTIPVIEDARTREGEAFLINPADFYLMELGGPPHWVTGSPGQQLEQDQDYDLKIAQAVHYVGLACVNRGMQARISGIDVSE